LAEATAPFLGQIHQLFPSPRHQFDVSRKGGITLWERGKAPKSFARFWRSNSEKRQFPLLQRPLKAPQFLSCGVLHGRRCSLTLNIVKSIWYYTIKLFGSLAYKGVNRQTLKVLFAHPAFLFRSAIFHNFHIGSYHFFDHLF
jgi:hypothetical protein